MKRRILSLAALLLIVLSVTAQAAETRMGGILCWLLTGQLLSVQRPAMEEAPVIRSQQP